MIDRHDFKPIYYQLAEQFRADIDNGKLTPGTKLPTEEELHRQYEVSRNTIRNMLKKLENEGYVNRLKGKGTFASIPESKETIINIVLTVPPKGHVTIRDLLTGAIMRTQQDNVRVRIFSPEQLKEELAEMRLSEKEQHAVLFMRNFCSDQELLDTLERLRIPTIFEGGEYLPGMNFVDIDNEDAMKKVVQHLVELGHKRIGLIAVDHPGNSHLRKRINTVQQELTALGLNNPDWQLVLSEEENPNVIGIFGSLCDGVETSFTRLFEGPKRPTAIICTGDHLAIRVIRWLQSKGIRVPEDISVTGFDNMERAALFTPRLTTINQDYYDIGYQATDYLLKMLENTKHRKLQVKLKLPLQVYDSTAAVNEPEE